MTVSRLAALLDQATPGPWSACVDEVLDQGGGTLVCRDFGGHCVFGNDDDARLIALAPDMARLLVDTFEWLNGGSEDDFKGLRARFAALDEKAGAS